MRPTEAKALVAALGYELDMQRAYGARWVRFSAGYVGDALFPELKRNTRQHYGTKILQCLEGRGFVERLGQQVWRVSERGRIAAALLLTREPGLRAFLEH